MIEITLFLFPRYWLPLPSVLRVEADGYVISQFGWLCFGIGLKWPMYDAETMLSRQTKKDDELES